MSTLRLVSSRSSKDSNTKPPETEGPASSALPIITINRLQTHEAASMLMDAIALRNDPPFLFRKGRTILILHSDGACHPVDVHALQGIMDESAQIIKLDRDGNARSIPLTVAPARHVLSRDLSSTKLPVLRDVIRAPILLNSGRVLDKPGYDRDSQLYLALPDGFEVLPRPTPSKEAALAAYAEISDLISQFPFADESGLANAMGYIVGVAAKHIINSKFPVLILTGQKIIGAGKSLLSEAIMTIATGVPIPKCALPESNDQVKKFLLAHFKGSPIGTIFDNVTSKKPINFASLNSAITAGETTDRVLQSSKNVSFDLRGHPIIINGNNLMLGYELARRSLPITFFCSVADPSKRRPGNGEFKHPGQALIRWCLDQRSQINAQLLTILESWVADLDRNGPPMISKTRTLASFEEWSRVVCSIMDFCGRGEQFMSHRDEVIAEHADEATEDYAFVGAIIDKIGSKPFQAHELLQLLNQHPTEPPGSVLPSSLTEKFGASSSKVTALGHWLKERRDTSFGVASDIRLIRKERPSRTGAAIWQLIDETKV